MTGGELTLVGMGCRAGQVSLAGAAALGRADWTGFFGLPADLRAELETLARHPLDLDRLLGDPLGFVQRLCDLAVCAARRLGRAALAIHGHPAIANPATPLLVAHAARERLTARIIAAPSVLDNYLAYTGEDPVSHGITLVDARTLIRMPLAPTPGLGIWNCGYLSADELRLMHARLVRTFGTDRPVRIFRAGPQPRIDPATLDRDGLWLSRLTTETTIFVH